MLIEFVLGALPQNHWLTKVGVFGLTLVVSELAKRVLCKQLMSLTHFLHSQYRHTNFKKYFQIFNLYGP